MASQLQISIKRKKNVLTFVQKIEILDKLKIGKVASLSKNYEINESSDREIRKNEETIRRSVM